jgi:hypothetical protein
MLEAGHISDYYGYDGAEEKYEAADRTTFSEELESVPRISSSCV